MTNTHKLTELTDPDAIYVLDRIAAADKAAATAKLHDSGAQSARELEAAERLKAGARLIEVRTRMLAKPGQRACPGFARWYEENGIPQSTVQRLMKLAGFTEEQREEHKAEERERKATERAKPKTPAAPAPRMMGWTEAAEDYLGTLPAGWTRNTLSQIPAKRAALEKHLGWTLPVGGEKIEAKGTKARQIGEAILVLAKPASTHIEEIRETLTPKQQETFDQKMQRALAAQTAQQDATFRDAVKAALPEEITKLKTKYVEGIREYNIMCAGIAPNMSDEDYKFIIQNTHSDRRAALRKNPDSLDPILDRIFLIVRGLDPYMTAFRKHRSKGGT